MIFFAQLILEMENRVNGEPEVVDGDLYFVQDQHLVLVYPKHQIKVIFIISYSNAYIKCFFFIVSY